MMGDSEYIGWLNKWNKWKFEWCESTEVIVHFQIKAIVKGKYTPEKHSYFTQLLSGSIGPSRMGRDSTITINTAYSPVSAEITCGNLSRDEFGIVTFDISFLARQDILRVALCLEELGHGVIHDGGAISSKGCVIDDTERGIKRKMPHQSDPIWKFI